MKVRLTILTENNRPVPNADRAKIESLTKTAWELLLNEIALMGENEDRATVESVEIVEDGDGDG